MKHIPIICSCTDHEHHMFVVICNDGFSYISVFIPPETFLERLKQSFMYLFFKKKIVYQDIILEEENIKLLQDALDEVKQGLSSKS